MTTQIKTNLTVEEIQSKLAAHALWLKTKRREGAWADFSNTRIDGFSFEKHVLTLASFYNAAIYQCNFSDSVLNDASFAAAELIRCDFISARLDNTDFSWAKINGCDFRDARHLTVPAFKRSNLFASIMPENFSFAGTLEYTNELIKKARNMFVACLGFTLTSTLLLLFSNRDKSAEHLTVQLPLVGQEIVFSPLVGLLLNLTALTVLWAFFSLSLSAVKHQIDKIPAKFPDARLTCETAFPWFWVTWITEIWQSDPTKDKHRLWQRLSLLSSSGNIYYVSVFITFLLICFYSPVMETLKAYECYAAGGALILLVVTLATANKIHHKSFLYFAGFGALLAWAIIYYFADASYMLAAAYCMILAWWWDTFTFSNETFSMDLSVPEASFNAEELAKISKYVEPRFAFTNVIGALIAATVAAIYIWRHQLYS